MAGVGEGRYCLRVTASGAAVQSNGSPRAHALVQQAQQLTENALREAPRDMRTDAIAGKSQA